MQEAPTKAFVEWNHNNFPFNDSFVSTINHMSSSCGYDDFLAEGLTFPPKGPLPWQPGTLPNGTIRDECLIFETVLEAIATINPCFDIYEVGAVCPYPSDVLGSPYTEADLPNGYDQPYFNRTDVRLGNSTTNYTRSSSQADK